MTPGGRQGEHSEITGATRVSFEAKLRGILLGFAAFLIVTGSFTAPFASPPAWIQLVQVAHTVAGVATIGLGLAYLVCHLRDAAGGFGPALRRMPRLSQVGTALFVVGVSSLALPTSTTVARHLVNTCVTGGLVSLLVAVAAALFRFIPKVSARGLRLSGLGALAMLAAILAGLTGAGLTSGSALYGEGTLSPSSRPVHVVTSFAFIGLATVHALDSWRNRRSRSQAGASSYSWRRPLIGLTIPAAVGLMVATGLATWRGLAELEPPRSSNGTLVPTTVGFSRLPDGCADCHPDVVDGWRNSSHALAASNPLFTSMLRRLVVERGSDAARFCLGCHAPHALDPGQGSFEQVVASEGYRAGVHCVTCHRSVPGPGHGDGSLAVSTLAADSPTSLPLAWALEGVRMSGPFTALATHSLISARLDGHRARFRFASHEAASCLPCHVQTLTRPTEGRLTVALQDQYDSWAASEAARAGLDCKQCHMPWRLSAGDYPFADHRFVAASTYVQSQSQDPGAVHAVVAMLEGRVPVPGPSRQDVVRGARGAEPALAPRPLVDIDVSMSGSAANLSLRVALRSTGRIGHSFPNGPTDLFQVWLAVKVVDARSRVLVDLGETGPGDAPRLGHAFRDRLGRPIEDHRLWAITDVVDLGHVPADGNHVIAVPLPAGPYDPPLDVQATLKYRRLDPALVEQLAPGAAPVLPIVSMVSFHGSLG